MRDRSPITLRSLPELPVSFIDSLYASVFFLLKNGEILEKQDINALRLELAEKVTCVLERYQNNAGTASEPPLWCFAKD